VEKKMGAFVGGSFVLQRPLSRGEARGATREKLTTRINDKKCAFCLVTILNDGGCCKKYR
jgi:hypothetical protein